MVCGMSVRRDCFEDMASSTQHMPSVTARCSTRKINMHGSNADKCDSNAIVLGERTNALSNDSNCSTTFGEVCTLDFHAASIRFSVEWGTLYCRWLITRAVNPRAL